MIKRREFIAGLGSAAAWPLAAQAQQPALPVVGYLGARSLDWDAHLLTAIRRGLSETGYIEGQNLRIEYRWADGQLNRLPALALDLAGRHVAVIVAGGGPAAPAAKAATSRIPIVFSTGSDPVKVGLVPSLNRPGGNLTGVTTFVRDFGPKRLGLLHELVPKAATIAVLANPDGSDAEPQIIAVQTAARAIGRPFVVLKARTDREIDQAFETIVEHRAGGLLLCADTFFVTRRDQIVALAARYAVPTIYWNSEEAELGGLMSYGTSFVEMYHIVGTYTGRILKGEKPADLPVQQSTKFEFVINLKTAKALGLTIPESLLATADQVIE
jgi:putative tryptophan/tyrosine transport system substrate-binding protein